MAKSRVRLRQLNLSGKALGEALSIYTCRWESHPPASTLHSLTYFAKLNKGFRKVFLKLFTFNHAFHGTGFSKQFVAIECFCQDVRGLAVAASFASAFEVINNASDLNALQEVRNTYLSKKGLIPALMKEMKDLQGRKASFWSESQCLQAGSQ